MPTSPTPTPSRAQSIWASRAIIVICVVGAFASFFYTPHGFVEHALDIVGRGYVLFIAGAMAHEGTHGHLGNSQRANAWWGRLALLPTTVPYVLLRKTHLYHHQYTNVPGQDPDEFLHVRRWQIPAYALLMPHHWMLWLKRTGRLTPTDAREYALTYFVYAVVYGLVIWQVGALRFATGLIPATVVHAYVLWIPFAIKTHEGYSVGSSDSRSHNYYGAFAYWLSCGLSLHRVHHQKPNLGWLQMVGHIERRGWLDSLMFRRDVRPDEPVA